MLVLVAGISASIYVGWRGATPADIYRVLPTPWLVREAKKAMPSKDAAVVELYRRVTSNRINDRHAREIVEAGLLHQADRSLAWMQAWGDTLGALRRTGKMDDQQFQRMLQTGVLTDLSLDKRYHINQPPTFQLKIEADRLPVGIRLQINYSLVEALVDGVKVDVHAEGSTAGSLESISGVSIWMTEGGRSKSRSGAFQSSVGVHPITAAYKLDITDMQTGMVAPVRRTLTASAEFIDPSDPLVRTVTDEAIGHTLASQIEAYVEQRDDASSSSSIMLVSLSCRSIDFGVVAEVSVRKAGAGDGGETKEWKATPPQIAVIDNEHTTMVYALPFDAASDVDSVDVILTHSPKHIGTQSHTQNIYAGTIVIRNVRLVRNSAPIPARLSR